MVTNLKMTQLHLECENEQTVLDYENLKALMNVTHRYIDDIHQLEFHVSIEEDDKEMYSFDCIYTFDCDEDEDQKAAVFQAIRIASGKLEDLISLLTFQIKPKVS